MRMLRLCASALLLLSIACTSQKKIPYAVKHGLRFEFDMEAAGEIKLIGSWNSWDKNAHTMQRWGSYYWLDVDVAPGRHEYFFMSDKGRFLPQNTGETIEDGFGGVNAVAVIE